MKRGLFLMLAVLGAGILIVVGLRFLSGPEDTWIKDSRGVWVKHGNPQNTPDEVTKQQNFIAVAENLFQAAKTAGKDLSNGPCLGNADNDTVVDIVHSPRGLIDDLPENQCAAFREGTAYHFIELDLDGSIVRIE